MQYEKDSKYTNIVFIILILISLLCLFSRASSYVKAIKNIAYYIVYPGIEVSHLIVTSTDSISENFKSILRVHQDNLNYLRINHELSDKLRNYDQMKRDYDDLVDLLRLKKIKYTNTIFSRISAREVSEWYQWFIIDKGKSDGLYAELPVEAVNKDGEFYAVGRIYEVYEHSSKVALITNPLSGVPVEIKGKNINCFAEGMNSGLLKITYIPFDADVVAGDEVITSNLSSVFADGTIIGVIKDVSKEPSVDFKTANAEPYFLKEPLNSIVVPVTEKEIN
ncbi:hypothetical protein ATZ36_13630 [Candidatus Endomicrobiellum trichonymphae]|uniref:Cell shape-determining protein MreC n=1 Tax=Endomicrobium trichonymphae TaxID=1408204 RepID=A0A1E5IMD3_ENDTX|nr:hypothetical protein ATZ36_13630 [Candidatus Endomicrobium trichonymphae]